jgi:hypothetical protein
MHFFSPRSLLRDACSQKVSKNLKIVCAQVTQTKTGLSAVRTFSPLGVNRLEIYKLKDFSRVLKTLLSLHVTIVKIIPNLYFYRKFDSHFWFQCLLQICEVIFKTLMLLINFNMYLNKCI